MKKYFVALALTVLLVPAFLSSTGASAMIFSKRGSNTALVSSTLVISQVYQGGGGSGGTYRFDYVELKNISGSPQSLQGLSLYYGSATGNFASQTSNAYALPNVTLNPGQYYLVQLGTEGTGGTALPVAPDVSTTNLAMQANSGKIALVNTAGLAQNICGSTATPCNASQLSHFVDWVAYGAAGNGAAGNGEGGTSVNNGIGLTATQGSVRKAAGCTDTDNNNLDFDVVTNPVPRNTGSSATLCAGVTPTPTPSTTPTPSPTPSPTPVPTPTPTTLATVVISQFQAGGGTSNDEFVELHNIGAEPVDLNGYRLVYRSAAGSNDVGPFAAWSTSTILQPGQYYLVAATGYDGSVTPDATYDPSVCLCSMSGVGGGLALRPSISGTPVDMVGWGTATNGFIETAVTAAPANNDSRSRFFNGCQDTQNNANDFTGTSPSAPRNTAAAAFNCTTGAGENLFASMTASPFSVVPSGNTLLTVTVTPATTPPSTGIQVAGNLSTIGGLGAQPFYDDGTNGDITAGDNVFSYVATVPAGTSGGVYQLTATVTDSQSRTVNLNQSITVIAPSADENPLLFGNPSYATPDIANENNYLMVKPQYSLSYSRAKATANWVAWRLDSSWIGQSGRTDDWAPDATLPAGWYRVVDSDYSGSGYDRGHMVPSGDRTRTVSDNQATFLMTNIVPQLGANNQGPWNDFENYLRSLATAGNEIYIISGPTGSIGTIAGGKIVVPQYTWKVVLILQNGNNDLKRVSRATRAFGIVVPNFSPINSNAWRNYRVTVDAVEALTGHNFYSEIPKNTQEIIERKRDKL